MLNPHGLRKIGMEKYGILWKLVSPQFPKGRKLEICSTILGSGFELTHLHWMGESFEKPKANDHIKIHEFSHGKTSTGNRGFYMLLLSIRELPINLILGQNIVGMKCPIFLGRPSSC